MIRAIRMFERRILYTNSTCQCQRLERQPAEFPMFTVSFPPSCCGSWENIVDREVTYTRIFTPKKFSYGRNERIKTMKIRGIAGDTIKRGGSKENSCVGNKGIQRARVECGIHTQEKKESRRWYECRVVRKESGKKIVTCQRGIRSRRKIPNGIIRVYGAKL